MNTKQHFGLSNTTLEKLRHVFTLHPAIESVFIYGSRAKGNYRPGSDIDLTIKGTPIPFAELMQIEDQIDDLLLPYTVDLSQYAQIGNPNLVEHINRVGVLLYMREPRHKKNSANLVASKKKLTP
jgi:predicted nucleotidyltransferase